ncbi:cyclic AMP-responsive element-binding protein 3-like protein 4 [Xenopus laevis]|uniref:Cyclic AMP-responsive element-binding protein 3-like protein 4 n=2 Tax=Xenopus laevis TaxID=8355 RepID=A0A974C554_XENLA|nr:cyclic AMP-responsive element-binding protein 3-like protein 4 [Xenopus laevis]OCT66686.1 hypothetical protein XELAEV_18042938mg [Xenopus laevis]
MDSARPDMLMGSLFEQTEELFHSEGFPGSEHGNFPLSELQFPAEKMYEEWPVRGPMGLSEREDTDEFLQMMINPNEVYSSGAAAAESPESDSGFSDDPRPDTPMQSESSPPLPQPTPVYELVYDIGSLEERKLQNDMSSVISIQLADDWNSAPLLIPESCIVNTLSPACKSTPLPIRVTPSDLIAVEALYPELHLTEEEKRLLSQEGVALPNNLPLTKAEERILKKVRRKIRNKQSAQDSRRRKKEYIDGLESRVAACSVQNQELHKKVVELEKHNISLITQLRKLQTLIKQTSNKAAQTGTCVLILLFSLALLVFPSFSPFRSGPNVSPEDSYRPSGVISRNILNKGGFSEVADSLAPPDAPPHVNPLEERDSGRHVAPPANPQPEETEQESNRAGAAPEDKGVPIGLKTDVLAPKGEPPANDLSKSARTDEM